LSPDAAEIGRSYRKRRFMTRNGSEKVGAATRPASVIWYERLAWAACAASLASAVAHRAVLMKYYSQYPIFYPIVLACVLAVNLLWIWLIARKRQNWARWISLVLMLLAIPLEILHFDERLRLSAAQAITYYAATISWMVAVSLLFRRDARRWFAGRPLVSEADLSPQD
jgi:hypothetical protein